MAVAITSDDVRLDFDLDFSSPTIDMYIELVNEADACLDQHEVSAASQKIIKIAGVRHMLFGQINSGRGTIKSETAPNGSGRSFAGHGAKSGSPYMDILDQVDKHGCVSAIVSSDGPYLGAWSVGGSCHP